MVSAGSSSDPAGFTLVYDWSCTVLTDACVDSSGNTISLGSASSITIPSSQLINYQNYTISLTLSTSQAGDTRQASTYIDLYAINSPTTAIWIDNPYRPSHQYDLEVYPLIEAPDDAVYSWTKKHGTTVDFTTVTSLTFISFETTATNPLQEGVTYHFELSISDASSNLLSSATLLFTTNKGPSGGTFSVTPLTQIGTAFQTPFLFTAAGWLDGDNLDYPLKYNYYFKVSSNNSKFSFEADTTKSSYTAQLSTSVDKAIIEVCDDRLTCTSQEFDLTVSSNASSSRMLSEDIMQAYYKMIDNPVC